MIKKSGFTLIELMIVVVIIGILASIGYPSYLAHIASSNRAEGASALLQIASAQERFYTANGSYASSVFDGAGLNLSDQSETGLYAISTTFNGGVNSTYTLTATPVAPWTGPDCGSLLLTNIGTRNVTADADYDGNINLAANPNTVVDADDVVFVGNNIIHNHLL